MQLSRQLIPHQENFILLADKRQFHRRLALRIGQEIGMAEQIAVQGALYRPQHRWQRTIFGDAGAKLKRLRARRAGICEAGVLMSHNLAVAHEP